MADWSKPYKVVSTWKTLPRAMRQGFDMGKLPAHLFIVWAQTMLSTCDTQIPRRFTLDHPVRLWLLENLAAFFTMYMWRISASTLEQPRLFIGLQASIPSGRRDGFER